MIAQRDELKLEPPVIKVQVKRGAENAVKREAQESLGCLGQKEYGLFITVAGFSQQALDFAKSRSSIRRQDGAGLAASSLSTPRTWNLYTECYPPEVCSRAAADSSRSRRLTAR